MAANGSSAQVGAAPAHELRHVEPTATTTPNSGLNLTRISLRSTRAAEALVRCVAASAQASVFSCGQNRMKLRPRARPTNLDAALGLLAPFMGLLTFPHRLGRPENPLHFYLGRFITHYEWAYLPTTCMGTPYGPADAVRTELLLDLADDFFIF